MADEIERLLVRVEANATQFEAAMRKLNRTLYGTQAETRKTLNQIKRDFDRAGRDMASAFAPVQLAASVALGAIVGFSYNAARRAEAVNGAFEQVFRDMPAEAQRAVTAIAEEFGRLETDVKDNFTQLRGVLTALGVDAEQSLQIVDQLNRRALDIAAFRNVSDAEAFRAVISGITGETEPLKRFGIVVNETATKAELLRLGFRGNASEASEAAKSIARANIILRQSAEMHGQVARESETLAEQEKRTRAEFTRAAEDFGQKFLPVAKDVLEWATDALEAFTRLPEGTQAAALGLLALVAASGPIAAVITGLRALIGAATAARVALAAVGGSAAAGGVAGAATAGGAAGLLARTVPVAAVGAGIIGSVGSFAPAPYQGADNDRRLEQAIRDRDQARALANDTFLKSATVVAAQSAALEQAEARVAAAQAAVAQGATLRQGLNDLAYGDPAAAAEAALADLGDFGLSDAQQNGTDGPSGRDQRGRTDRTPALRAALGLELAIAQARATGDEAAIRAAEEREELGRLVQQYEAAGYENATFAAAEHLALINQATLLAEERERQEEALLKIKEASIEADERAADEAQRINEVLLDQLAMQAEMASLSGNDGALRDIERRIWLEERINELIRLRLADTKEEARARAEGELAGLENADAQGRFRSFVVEAGMDFGGLVEEAGDRFKRRALEGLADALFNIINGAFKGQGDGGSGNIISSIFSSLFGGGRAFGGPVEAGKIYRVNENTPNSEFFAPGVDGTIIPRLKGMGMPQGGGRQVVEHRITVSPERDSFIALASDAAVPVVAQGGAALYGAQKQEQAMAQRRARQRFV